MQIPITSDLKRDELYFLVAGFVCAAIYNDFSGSILNSNFFLYLAFFIFYIFAFALILTFGINMFIERNNTENELLENVTFETEQFYYYDYSEKKELEIYIFILNLIIILSITILPKIMEIHFIGKYIEVFTLLYIFFEIFLFYIFYQISKKMKAIELAISKGLLLFDKKKISEETSLKYVDKEFEKKDYLKFMEEIIKNTLMIKKISYSKILLSQKHKLFLIATDKEIPEDIKKEIEKFLSFFDYTLQITKIISPEKL